MSNRDKLSLTGLTTLLAILVIIVLGTIALTSHGLG